MCDSKRDERGVAVCQKGERKCVTGKETRERGGSVSTDEGGLVVVNSII